jgi:hypothetical protein
VDPVISSVVFGGGLVVVLGATIAVTSVFLWLKILIRIIRSSLDAVPRALLFGLVVFTGPFAGTAIGWLALRLLRPRRNSSENNNIREPL